MKRSLEPTPSTEDTAEKRTRAISGSVHPLDFGDKRSDDDPVQTRKPPVRFKTNQPQFGGPDFYRQMGTIKGLGAGYAPHLTVFADTPAALKQTGAANTPPTSGFCQPAGRQARTLSGSNTTA
jgi:hypothetical protein